MIVCSGCGLAVHSLDATCGRCSGRGIERPASLKGFLTPTQHQGSPDRWARSYTTPPSGSSKRETTSRMTAGTVDIPIDQSSEALARVYGSVLDLNIRHPSCTVCSETIPPGQKLYLAPRAATGCARDDVLCRKCYSDLFRLGNCDLCRLPILGEREEGGPHVKGRCDVKWHAKCFVCTTCSVPLSKTDHILLPAGAPSCLTCAKVFDDTPAPRPPHSAQSALSTTRVIPPSRSFPSVVPRETAIAIQANRKAISDLKTAATRAIPAAAQYEVSRRPASTLKCPGCGVNVGLIENGTTRGPADTRWHARCLRCGIGGKTGKGCGKQLDSAATTQNGTPVCRLCSSGQVLSMAGRVPSGSR